VIKEGEPSDCPRNGNLSIAVKPSTTVLTDCATEFVPDLYDITESNDKQLFQDCRTHIEEKDDMIIVWIEDIEYPKYGFGHVAGVVNQLVGFENLDREDCGLKPIPKFVFRYLPAIVGCGKKNVTFINGLEFMIDWIGFFTGKNDQIGSRAADHIFPKNKRLNFFNHFANLWKEQLANWHQGRKWKGMDDIWKICFKNHELDPRVNGNNKVLKSLFMRFLNTNIGSTCLVRFLSDVFKVDDFGFIRKIKVESYVLRKMIMENDPEEFKKEFSETPIQKMLYAWESKFKNGLCALAYSRICIRRHNWYSDVVKSGIHIMKMRSKKSTKLDVFFKDQQVWGYTGNFKLLGYLCERYMNMNLDVKRLKNCTEVVGMKRYEFRSINDYFLEGKPLLLDVVGKRLVDGKIVQKYKYMKFSVDDWTHKCSEAERGMRVKHYEWKPSRICQPFSKCRYYCAIVDVKSGKVKDSFEPVKCDTCIGIDDDEPDLRTEILHGYLFGRSCFEELKYFLRLDELGLDDIGLKDYLCRINGMRVTDFVLECKGNMQTTFEWLYDKFSKCGDNGTPFYYVLLDVNDFMFWLKNKDSICDESLKNYYLHNGIGNRVLDVMNSDDQAFMKRIFLGLWYKRFIEPTIMYDDGNVLSPSNLQIKRISDDVHLSEKMWVRELKHGRLLKIQTVKEIDHLVIKLAENNFDLIDDDDVLKRDIIRLNIVGIEKNYLFPIKLFDLYGIGEKETLIQLNTAYMVGGRQAVIDGFAEYKNLRISYDIGINETCIDFDGYDYVVDWNKIMWRHFKDDDVSYRYCLIEGLGRQVKTWKEYKEYVKSPSLPAFSKLNFRAIDEYKKIGPYVNGFLMLRSVRDVTPWKKFLALMSIMKKLGFVRFKNGYVFVSKDARRTIGEGCYDYVSQYVKECNVTIKFLNEKRISCLGKSVFVRMENVIQDVEDAIDCHFKSIVDYVLLPEELLCFEFGKDLKLY